MAEPSSKPVGNILGAARAEVDSLLGRAFVETAAYRALVENTDYNFVVGRRGTGKSALFQRLREDFASAPQVVVLAVTPEEHHMMELQNLLVRNAGLDYGLLRAISRLIWRANLLLDVLTILRPHYKFLKGNEYAFLAHYISDHKPLLEMRSSARPGELLRAAIRGLSHGVEVAPKVAAMIDIDQLQKAVAMALQNLETRAIVLYDGLDEGWVPDTPATAVLGGLAIAAADLTDRRTGITSVLFVRDNIFRALAQIDTDFTRHIEGHTLRLHWDENSLLHFIARRLRVALNLDIESDIKTWNRFAHRALQEREGFQLCLHYTLYRPRDVIVLLNDAYDNASREGRSEIIETDIESSSTRISQHRLADLLKEYEIVFPGLKLFVDQFHGRPIQEQASVITAMLDSAVETADY